MPSTTSRSFLPVIFILFFAQPVCAQIRIETGFEGGNARVLQINNRLNLVKITSELKAGEKHPVAILCRISGFDRKRPLKVVLPVIDRLYIPFSAFYSVDAVRWEKTPATIGKRTAEYLVPTEGQRVYFSTHYPYRYSDLENYLRKIAVNEKVGISDLDMLETGIRVPMVRIAGVNHEQQYAAWIIARQHAFESNPSFVVEGLIDKLLSGDPEMEQLIGKTVFYIVPMMDVKAVIEGRAGKDQEPGDFNRDWNRVSAWSAITAFRGKMRSESKKYRANAFIDIHNPWPGNKDACINYLAFSLYSSGSQRGRNLDLFLSTLNGICGFDICIRPMFDSKGKTSIHWVNEEIDALDFAFILEVGFLKRPDGRDWDTLGYRELGGSMVNAFRGCLGNR
ncbi:MAG: hypothetical protein JW969_20340 [Spirochaetales bacterium]|nr:hypothetical protein [Spirochaetales bacterium]